MKQFNNLTTGVLAKLSSRDLAAARELICPDCRGAMEQAQIGYPPKSLGAVCFKCKLVYRYFDETVGRFGAR